MMLRLCRDMTLGLRIPPGWKFKATKTTTYDMGVPAQERLCSTCGNGMDACIGQTAVGTGRNGPTELRESMNESAITS